MTPDIIILLTVMLLSEEFGDTKQEIAISIDMNDLPRDRECIREPDIHQFYENLLINSGCLNMGNIDRIVIAGISEIDQMIRS